MLKPIARAAERAAVMLEVIYAPESALARGLQGPSWLTPFSVLGPSFMLLSYLQMPLSVNWAREQMLAAGAPQAQIEAGLAMIWRMQRWAVLIVPLLLLAKWLGLAVPLWLTAQLATMEIEFSSVIRVVSFAYVPVLFRDAVVLFILWARSAAAIHGTDAMNVAIGLNLLVPGLPLPWSALAGHINLFELWFVFLLALGTSKAAAMRLQTGWAVVLPTWALVLCLQFGMVALGTSMRAGLGR
jgi:hypothetical protein